MPKHFEESLQHDIDQIRSKIGEMAALAERGLRDCLTALREKNRVLAFSVILRDRQIDELEVEIDRLCLAYLVRQQPAGGPLRMAYATIRINLEIERVGDYAESIARQLLKLTSMEAEIPTARFVEIAELSIPMFCEAVQSFIHQDAPRAQAAAEIEERVDVLKSKLNADLMRLNRENHLSFEALNALMMIARHFERVSDQARNICAEVHYMCTGQNSRHGSFKPSRLLFIGRRSSGPSFMAEAIARSFNPPVLTFASAGLEESPADARTAAFLTGKGLDVSFYKSRILNQLTPTDEYQVIVALSPDARRLFPKAPTKVVCLDWSVADPLLTTGGPTEIKTAYEKTFQFLHEHIRDLIQAVAGDRLV